MESRKLAGKDRHTLKLWKWNDDSQKFAIHSQIEGAHEDHEIHRVVFNPEKEQFVTLGADKGFKVWSLQTDASSRAYWMCILARNYKLKKHPKTAVYSSDASVLAVAYEELIALWNAETYEFLFLLNNGGSDACIKQLEMSSQHLISISSRGLRVWDLLSCSAAYSYSGRFQHVKCDPRSNMFVAVEELVDEPGCMVYVFSAGSSLPVYAEKRTVSIAALAFLPLTQIDEIRRDRSTMKASNLILLDADSNLFSFNTTAPKINSRRMQTEDTSRNSRIWQAGGQLRSNAQQTDTAIHRKVAKDLDLFKGAAHILPGLQHLFAPFMQQHLH